MLRGMPTGLEGFLEDEEKVWEGGAGLSTFEAVE